MNLESKKNIRLGLSHRAMLFLSGLLGTIFFLVLFGADTLKFNYVNWIYNSYNDIIQHYVGWVYYRNSDWSFPIGVFSGLTGDIDTSFVYTDSIPLFAIIFKIFRSVLPDTFQYLGLFTLLSFIFQAIFGSELVYRLTRKTFQSLLSSLFFLSATILVQRSFEHTSLTCHAIILMAIILFLHEKEGEAKHIYLKWNVLLIIAVLVHAYYVPMVLSFELFYYIKISDVKDWYRVMARMMLSLVLVVMSMYAIGYFYSADYTSEQDWLWQFGIALNAFWSSNGHSLISIIGGRNNNNWELEEGYAYLGIGMILMSLIATIITIKNRKELRKNKRFWLAFILAVFFIILAMIPTIRWNWNVLIKVPLPGIIKKVLGIFRSNGRFVWPAVYLLMAFSSAVIIRKIPKKANVIISMCVLIQIIDLLPFYAQMSNALKERINNKYTSEMMEYIPDNIDNVMLMGETNSEELAGFDFRKTVMLVNFAVDRQINTSDSYIARKDESAISNDMNNIYRRLLEGEAIKNTLYIFPTTPYELLLCENGLIYYSLDGMICAVDSSIEGIEVLDIHKGINTIATDGYIDVDIETCEGVLIQPTTENVYIESGHCLYKDMRLGKGNYRLELTGDGFSGLGINIVGDSCKYEVLVADDNKVIIDLSVTEDCSDNIIQIINSNNSVSVVDKLVIYN